MSRAGTTPRDVKSLLEFCAVAAALRQIATSMMESELDFMRILPVWGPLPAQIRQVL
jgi:hypothetical protein